jgi:hypothetical protein
VTAGGVQLFHRHHPPKPDVQVWLVETVKHERRECFWDRVCRPETPLSLFKQAVRMVRQQPCGDVLGDAEIEQKLCKAVQLLEILHKADATHQPGTFVDHSVAWLCQSFCSVQGSE